MLARNGVKRLAVIVTLLLVASACTGGDNSNLAAPPSSVVDTAPTTTQAPTTTTTTEAPEAIDGAPVTFRDNRLSAIDADLEGALLGIATGPYSDERIPRFEQLEADSGRQIDIGHVFHAWDRAIPTEDDLFHLAVSYTHLTLPTIYSV